jgi:hypothetical protein
MTSQTVHYWTQAVLPISNLQLQSQTMHVMTKGFDVTMISVDFFLYHVKQLAWPLLTQDCRRCCLAFLDCKCYLLQNVCYYLLHNCDVRLATAAVMTENVCAR